MDISQYLEVFIDESKEHLQMCNEQLLELEKNPDNLEIVNVIFRSAHTLKGMSATMGYEDLASLTHQMENVLDGIRNNKIKVTSQILDIVFKAVDYLEEMIFSIAEGGTGKKDVSDVVTLLKKIEDGENLEINSDSPKQDDNKQVSPIKTKSDYDEFELTVLNQSKEQGFNIYEISITLRQDCVLKAARVFMIFEVLEQVGEVIKTTPSVDMLEEENFDHSFKVSFISMESSDELKGRVMKVSEVETVDIETISLESLAHQVINEEVAPTVELETEEVSKEPVQKEKDVEKVAPAKQNNVNNKTIRVSIERLDILMNLFEELVIDRGRLEQISRELTHSDLSETVERMSRISGDLQSIILNMRMVPVDTVFNRFPRMVRQLARDLNKKIDLQIVGAETELDRTVIDEIGDPLVHLIRNAMDHGIETPEVRKASGKPEEGTLILKAYHSGNHVFIEIQDNGAGINRDKVIEKARKQGIISESEIDSLTDKQVFDLILSSGFSTADKISDVSGRGVGLDVVKSTIESLGGSISIDSIEGKGSTFLIQLPLTLSIISVLLVELGDEKYAIPLSSIIETAIIKKEEILSAHNQKVIDFRNKVIPLVFLEDFFEVPSEEHDSEYVSVVIVKKGEKAAGFVVDSFIGQQEVVLKSLGNYLSSVFAISGATILGDGQVALIVDCNALIK
ncbi:chemotaxis protein CheA [Litchfieldia salsa]|uniref:Chemotaxis protein CheA n=1 Tax=Litchfieldia salsa TaxID=930152 RepID=A0A1H0R5W5_9BACI|nr:chemotaxis protein CheA [Litchfieldia salsa]SDP24877.1 two-component system, chemotaxis family, sensor kinase CheA [Litchfieldia salsa]